MKTGTDINHPIVNLPSINIENDDGHPQKNAKELERMLNGAYSPETFCSSVRSRPITALSRRHSVMRKVTMILSALLHLNSRPIFMDIATYSCLTVVKTFEYNLCTYTPGLSNQNKVFI